MIETKTEIFECAKAFRQDANYLMSCLAKLVPVAPERGTYVAEEVFAHKYNNKGFLGDEWTYFFHGAECRFDNLKTGQVVELIYVTQPEFGYLDAYFFFNYMSSTDRFKVLADTLETVHITWEVVEALAKNGILKRDLSAWTNRNIIAY